MDRRRALALAAGVVGWVLLTGHSPYRQWIVYRETHLIILTSRDDPGADELGEKFAAIVRQALPDSKAAVGRGPRVQRIASLIASGQAAVGVVSRENALAMYRGLGVFKQFGPIALRVLVQNKGYRLVCREDFLAEHGFLLAEALMANGGELGLSIPADDAAESGDVPVHVGAAAFSQGRPLDLRGAR